MKGWPTVQEQQRRSGQARLNAYFKHRARKKGDPSSKQKNNANFKNMRLFDKSKLSQGGHDQGQLESRQVSAAYAPRRPRAAAPVLPKINPQALRDWQLTCRHCDQVAVVRSTLNQMLEATIRCLHCKRSAAGAHWRR
jgi:hypothetical protein